MKLRVSSMWATLAWISTPGSAPCGVGKKSRLSWNVAPTSTMRPRNGLSDGTSAPGASSAATVWLGIVRKLLGRPTKLMRESSPGRTGSGASSGSSRPRRTTGSASAPPRSPRARARAAGVSPPRRATTARPKAGSSPSAPGTSSPMRRISPSASCGTSGEPRTVVRASAGSASGPRSGTAPVVRTTRLAPSSPTKPRMAAASAASSAVAAAKLTSSPTTAAPARWRLRTSVAR